MVVILLTGSKCSGKKSFVELLKKDFGWGAIDINEYLNDSGISNENKSNLENGVEVCKPQLKTTEERNENAEENPLFLRLEELKREIIRRYNENVVVHPVTHLAILQELRVRPYVIVVGVEASMIIRFHRWLLLTKDNTDLNNSKNLSLQHFVEADSMLTDGCVRCAQQSGINPSVLVAALATPGESCVRACIHSADFCISNADTIDALRECTRKLQLHSPSIFRPTFDDQFMVTAHVISSRSNCIRRRVGSVLTKDNNIISTGYNGTPRKTLDCMEGGCERCRDPSATRGMKLHVCLCVHAEANALIQAGMDRATGGTLYVTCFPCLDCAKLIIQARVKKLVYEDEYDRNEHAQNLLERNIEVIRYTAKPCKRMFPPSNQ